MNEDVSAYLQKAKDCLSDAEYLLKDDRLEAACNRSYYAIFDAVQALLSHTEEPYIKTHQGAHIRFRELYLKSGKLPLALNSILTEAFNLRQGSDYELDFELTGEKARQMFENATGFVVTIEAYLLTLS